MFPKPQSVLFCRFSAVLLSFFCRNPEKKNPLSVSGVLSAAVLESPFLIIKIRLSRLHAASYVTACRIPVRRPYHVPHSRLSFLNKSPYFQMKIRVLTVHMPVSFTLDFPNKNIFMCLLLHLLRFHHPQDCPLQTG